MLVARPAHVVAFLALLLSAPALVTLCGCRTPATQLDLRLESGCGRTEARRVLLVVFDTGGGEVSRETVDVSSWPIERSLLPRGGDATRRWRVEATLEDDAGTSLDGQSAEGGYTAGQRVQRTIRFADPGCGDAGAAADAGLDAGESSDAGLDAALVDDAPTDARVADAIGGPDAGCRVDPRRASDPALSYSVREDGLRPDVIEEDGSDRSLDLVGSSGSVRWLADGARIAAIGGRPAVARTAALGARLAACEASAALTAVTVEAWITVPTTPPPDLQRAEIFVFSEPRELNRSLFTLGLDATSFIAAIDSCDGQMRPLYRFDIPRRGVPLHVVYVRRGTLERAFIDGVEVALRAPVMLSERDVLQESDAGVDGGGRVQLACSYAEGGRIVPGSRVYGTTVRAAPQTAHLGSEVRVTADVDGSYSWREPFTGTYHLLAVYCRALSEEDIWENYCAGPRPD